MNFYKYPNNVMRPLDPSQAEVDAQIAALETFKTQRLLPTGMEAIANGYPIYGPQWKYWGRPGMRQKTWFAAVQQPIEVIVPARNADGSYKMVPFKRGTSHDFLLWSRPAIDFYEGPWGDHFPVLPVLESRVFTPGQAADITLGPGPAEDYPCGTVSREPGRITTSFWPKIALRMNAGEVEYFLIEDFMKEHPFVITGTTNPPTGVPDVFLVQMIAQIVNGSASAEKKINEIRALIR